MVFRYLAVHMFRVKVDDTQRLLEFILPELKKAAKFLVLLHIIFKILTPFIGALLVIRYKEWIINVTDSFMLEFVLVTSLIILLQLFRYNKISVNQGVSLVYSPKIVWVYYLMKSKISFSLIYILVLLMSISNGLAVTALILITCFTIYFFLKITKFNYKPYIIGLFVLGIFASLSLKNLNILLSFNLSNKSLFLALLIIIYYLFDKFKLIKYTSIINLKEYKVSNYSFKYLVIFIITLILTDLNLLKNISFFIAIGGYFLSIVFMKHEKNEDFTLESIGYFNFYLRTLPTEIQKRYLRTVLRNNMNVTALCAIPYIVLSAFNYGTLSTLFFLVLMIMEFFLDLLLTTTLPKILPKNQLNILFTRSLRGIVAGNLLSLPITMIALTFLFSFDYLEFIKMAIFIVALLDMLIVYLYFSWSNIYFKTLRIG